MGQFSNSFPKHFSYLCEYAFRFDLSCSFCEYPFIYHCLHCSPSCFDPDSLLLAHFWLGLSWIDYISANKRFSSSKTSSRKPYTNSKQQEKQKHSAETTINFSVSLHVSMGRVTCPLSWAAALGAAQLCGGSLTTRVLLPLVYRTTASTLWLELRGHSAWQASQTWTVYRLACCFRGSG